MFNKMIQIYLNYRDMKALKRCIGGG